MTVSNTTSRNQYTATSGQTVFPYTFEIFDKDDVAVLKNGALLSEGTDYTVSGVGNDSGGNITLTIGATAGDILTIYRDMAYQRLTDYQNSGDFLAQEVNDDFDRLWLAIQQQNVDSSRAVVKPITDSASNDMTLPSAVDRANSYLTFDATGAPSVVAAGDPSAPDAITRQDFTGDGATVIYTLASAPGAAGAGVMIFIDGIQQDKDSYTITGTTLTFSEAPPLNSNINLVQLKATDIGEADSASVTYIPAGTGAVQTSVQSKLRETVSVKDFGAVGDGITDDTAAIQAAFDSAKVVELAQGANYLVDNLIIPNVSGWTLIGNNSTLTKSANGDSYYLMASYKHINNIAEAQSPCEILNVNFNANSNADHALIIQNWDSDILDCKMFNAVLNGCMFSAETRAGTTFPTSSLVNTRFRIISRNNGGCGLFVQDSARNNATDGTILQGSQFYGNGDYGVWIEPGAGWDVECRTYANGGGIGFNGHGTGTLVHDCYIDDGNGSVSALPVTGSTYSAAVFASAALGATNFGVLPVTNCHISGPVTHAGSGDSAPYGIWSENNTYRTDGFIYHQYFASSRKIFSVNDRFMEANPFRFHNGSSTGIIEFRNAYLADKGWAISGKMNATNDSNYQIGRWDINSSQDKSTNFQVSPSAFSETVEVPPIPNYGGQFAKVYIMTRDNYNASLRCVYEGTLWVQAKVNGTDAWTKYLENVVYDAADFTTPPAASVSDNGDGTGEVTITFDTSAASGYGRCRIAWQ